MIDEGLSLRQTVEIMNTRQYLARTVLILFIIVSGVQVGAALYEATVITPLWSGASPESVMHWNPVPEYAINPGEFLAGLDAALLALRVAAGDWRLGHAAEFAGFGAPGRERGPARFRRDDFLFRAWID